MSNTEIFAHPLSVDLNGSDSNNLTEFSVASDGLPPAQAGSSKTAVQNGAKLVMDYSTDFPKLPESKAPTVPAGAWARRQLTTATITETFKLSSAERSSMNLGSKGFGHVEQQKCSQVAAATNTKIELCESADKALTILITGKRSDVDDAHARLVRELQTQASVEITIPREYYGSIIGKEGGRRKQMEQEYLCRIYLPGRDEQSDIIRVVGPIDQVKLCASRLHNIATEMAKQATEALEIPKMFYPWIRGPFNEVLDAIQSETGVKVNIPTSRSKNETIIISGEREGVAKAAAQVKAIYEAKKKEVKSVTCNVNRAQHRFIVGFQRSGLEDILKETGVVVEVPSEEDNSDTLTLRGPQNALGDALTLVYARASSIISLEIKYPEWQRKFLIGPKGATLQQLVPKQDKMNVEFENGGVIYLEGPPDAVKNAHVALSTEIVRLSKEMSSEVVKVPVYLHRHIIGRNGALINKIKDDNDVQITIPDEKLGSDEIKIEGKKLGVKKAVAIIKERASELEKKMPADKQPPMLSPEELAKTHLDVETKYHKHFVLRGAEVIREIQDQFLGVVISFPRQDTSDTKVSIKGPKDMVEGAKKRIEEIVTDLEAQTTISFEVAEEHHRSLVMHANDIRQRFNVRIRFPPRNTPREEGDQVNGIAAADLVHISGRQPNCDEAKQALIELIPISKTVIVPVDHHSSLIGKKGEAVKAIMQAHNVRVKIPSAEEQSEEIVISGPAANVEKALQDIREKVGDFEKNAEDRRLRSFKVTTDVPLAYHQRLIGPSGATIRDLSKRFDVRIDIPRDNTETITISGYVDKANEAKDEIERMIHELNNMVTLNISLDTRFHPRLIGQRGRNLKKIQEEYKVEINFAGRQDEDPSRVLVSGKTEEDVLDCIDKLRILEEDFLQDIVDRSQYQYQRRDEPVRQPAPQRIEITGAPWQLDSLEQFPSMSGAASASNQPTGVWGRRH